MARRGYEEPAPVSRGRVVATSLRSVTSVAVFSAVYYLAPLDQPLTPLIWVELALGLLVFAAVVLRQVQAILTSDVPRLRAVEALAVGLPLLLLVFAAAYTVIAHGVPGSFTQPITRTDALYFTVTVFSTVGFGDIAPRTDAARIATMIQMVIDLVVLGLVAKVLLNAVQVAVRRREGTPPEAGDPQEDG